MGRNRVDRSDAALSSSNGGAYSCGAAHLCSADNTRSTRSRATGRGLRNGGIFVTWLFLGFFSLIFAWYSTRISGKAKWLWTGLVAAQLAVIVIIVAVALHPGTGGVDTNAVEQFITANLPGSITGVASAPSDETVTVQNVSCLQATGNTWSCDATYAVDVPSENLTQDFSAALDVTCDSTGTCTYPPTQGTPTQ